MGSTFDGLLNVTAEMALEGVIEGVQYAVKASKEEYRAQREDKDQNPYVLPADIGEINEYSDSEAI